MLNPGGDVRAALSDVSGWLHHPIGSPVLVCHTSKYVLATRGCDESREAYPKNDCGSGGCLGRHCAHLFTCLVSGLVLLCAVVFFVIGKRPI